MKGRSTLTTSYTPPSFNNFGIADGAFSSGNDRYGIEVTGGTLNGSITNGSLASTATGVTAGITISGDDLRHLAHPDRRDHRRPEFLWRDHRRRRPDRRHQHPGPQHGRDGRRRRRHDRRPGERGRRRRSGGRHQRADRRGPDRPEHHHGHGLPVHHRLDELNGPRRARDRRTGAGRVGAGGRRRRGRRHHHRGPAHHDGGDRHRDPLAGAGDQLWRCAGDGDRRLWPERGCRTQRHARRRL